MADNVVRLLSTLALKGAVGHLADRYQAATGTRIDADFAPTLGLLKRLREGEIAGVVGGEILSQVPNPQGERIVRPPAQAERGEIVERLARPSGRNFAGGGISPQNLKDLEVDKMWRVEGLAALKQTLFDGWRGWGAEQDFEDGGGVDDDHRELRSSRTTTAGFRTGETALRPASRARSSLTVGRSALSAISASR